MGELRLTGEQRFRIERMGRDLASHPAANVTTEEAVRRMIVAMTIDTTALVAAFAQASEALREWQDAWLKGLSRRQRLAFEIRRRLPSFETWIGYRDETVYGFRPWLTWRLSCFYWGRLRSFARSVERQTGHRYGEGEILRLRDVIRQGEDPPRS